MIGRWFNQWVEDRLVIAIGLAADLRAVVGPGGHSSPFREATPDEVAAIGEYLAQHGLRAKAPGNVVPFPVPHETPADPPPPPSAA
ncbi:MAG: hypothetical protein ACRED4_06050 [Brevundimonas sp.]